jgi:hypothetical protein
MSTNETTSNDDAVVNNNPAPATTPSAPATTPSAPAATPSAPATTPSAPAATPSAPATTPSAPATTPASSGYQPNLVPLGQPISGMELDVMYEVEPATPAMGADSIFMTTLTRVGRNTVEISVFMFSEWDDWDSPIATHYYIELISDIVGKYYGSHPSITLDINEEIGSREVVISRVVNVITTDEAVNAARSLQSLIFPKLDAAEAAVRSILKGLAL